MYTSNATKWQNVDSINGIDGLSMASLVVWNDHDRYSPLNFKSIKKVSKTSPRWYGYRLVNIDIDIYISIGSLFIPIFIKIAASPGPPFMFSCSLTDFFALSCALTLSFFFWSGVCPRGLISEFKMGVPFTTHEISGLFLVPFTDRSNRVSYSLRGPKNSGFTYGNRCLQQCLLSDNLFSERVGSSCLYNNENN